MNVGERYRVVGPAEWLAQVGLQNRLGHVGILLLPGPVDVVNIEGRGMTPVFRIKFLDSLANMVHHVPGPCLKNVEKDEGMWDLLRREAGESHDFTKLLTVREERQRERAIEMLTQLLAWLDPHNVPPGIMSELAQMQVNLEKGEPAYLPAFSDSASAFSSYLDDLIRA